MIDFIEDNWGLILVMVIFLLIVAIIAKQENIEYNKHMTECRK